MSRSFCCLALSVFFLFLVLLLIVSLSDYLLRIEGKVTLSKVGTRTVEHQGDTNFCWLFAIARSVVQSMRMRLGK